MNLINKSVITILLIKGLLPIPVIALDENPTDGYSDVWVQEMAGGIVQPPASDLDGDGIPFHTEHALGLNPNEPNSTFFHIFWNNRIILELNDVPGVNYALEESSTLNPTKWLTIPLALPGDTDPAPYHIWAPSATPQNFWRIRGIGFQDSADGDPLNDFEEHLLGTDIHSSDTDGDKITDHLEFTAQLNPTQNLDTHPTDGLPDDWTAFHALTSSADDDEDQDGRSNLEEYTAGTHPLQSDSDGNGLHDGIEHALATSVQANGSGGVLVMVPDTGWYHAIDPDLDMVYLGSE